MDAAIIRRRNQKLKKALRGLGLDGLIVPKTENVRYLTGFSGDDSWTLVLPRGVLLITDSRYTEQARGECTGCRIHQRREAMSRAAAEQIGRVKAVRTMGIEKSVPLSLYQAVRLALRGRKVSLKPVGNLVESLRMVKEEGEIRLISRAGKIAWECLDAALGQIRAGMTEQRLAATIEYEMRLRGARAGFETIAAFGENGSRAHHQPSGRKLRKRDTVLIDFGVRIEGYTCDITRSFAFGEPTGEYRRAWESVYAAQQAAITAVREGVRAVDADAAARDVIRESGFPLYGHGTGHGIGLEVHERPSVSPLNRRERLRAGQVITIEPGIYLPGKFGIRIEDDVLVTKTGCRVLTKDQKYGFSGNKMPVLKNG